MPRNISAELLEHIRGECTTLATCFKVTRVDGVVMGFSSHVEDMAFGGLTYQAAAGVSPSTVKTEAGTGVDNLKVVGILSSETITELDIMAGRYDGALVEIFFVNYEDLSMGRLLMMRGPLGEVATGGGQFTVEIRSHLQLASGRIGETLTPGCRVKQFGDGRCGLDLGAFTFAAVVTEVSSRRLFRAAVLVDNPTFFEFGTLTFTTGPNAGLPYLIKGFDAELGEVELQIAGRAEVEAGHEFTIVAGCDRTLDRCKSYGNVINFRGEPYVPGADALIRGIAR